MSVTLVSVSSSGTASGNAISGGDTTVGTLAPSVSANGRYVAFASDATNLVTGSMDSNNAADVFVRDTQTNTTTLISADIAGSATGNAGSGISAALLGGGGGTEASGPVISPDGRYVAYVSTAANLVTGVNTTASNVFVRDLQAKKTILISGDLSGHGGSTGTEAGGLEFSGNSQFLVFATDAKDLTSGLSLAGGANVFETNLPTGKTVLVSAAPAGGVAANTNATDPSVSADGRYVVFASTATNLAPNLTGSVQNIYLRDTQAGTTTLVTRAATGAIVGGSADSISPVISSDGSTIVYSSAANNLVKGFIGTTDPSTGSETKQLYAYNVAAATTALVSGATTMVPAIGAKPVAGADLSAPSSSTLGSGATSFDAALSSNGQIVAFDSNAFNLVPNFVQSLTGVNIFVHNLKTNTTQLVSINAQGTGPANSFSSGSVANADNAPALSADGRFVGFLSTATDLLTPVPTSTTTPVSSVFNAYVRDTQNETTALLSTTGSKTPTPTPATSTSNGASAIVLSSDGTTAVFATDASNLVKGDSNSVADIFLAPVPGASTSPTPTPTPTPAPTPTPTPVPTGTIDFSVNLIGKIPPTAIAATKDSAKVGVLVTNGGTAEAKGKLRIRLYLSADQTLSSGDLPLANVDRHIKIRPGKREEIKVALGRIPALAFGSYYIIAQVNPDGSIAETNARNDVANSSGTINVVLPFVDLAAGQVVASRRQTVIGKKSSFTIEVENLGNVPVTGRLSIALTASTSPLQSTNDIALGTVSSRISIPANRGKKYKFSFRLPVSLPKGAYYLAASLNPKKQIAESNIANDTSVSNAPFVAE